MALQVARFDVIAIDNQQAARTSPGQQGSDTGPNGASADDGYFGLAELGLALLTDAGEEYLA